MGLYSGLSASQADSVEVRRAELEKGWQEYQKAMSVQTPSVDNMGAVGVLYNPANKQWKVTREKTDFKTDFEIRNKINTNFKTVRRETLRVDEDDDGKYYTITVRYDVEDGDGNVVHRGKSEEYAGKEEYVGSTHSPIFNIIFSIINEIVFKS